MIASRPAEHRALLEDLDHSADAAESAAGGRTELHLELAGLPVRLRFAGEALIEPLTLALAHLVREPAPEQQPALTVRLWDSASTGSPPPSPRWGPDAYAEKGTIRGFFGDGLYAIFQWGTRSLTVLDAESERGFFWVSSGERLGMPEWGEPLRALLNLWLGARGVQLVHAAAVGTPRGCALLVGPSGAGKSTTALSCLRSPLLHLGEDYCLVRPGDPAIVSSIFSTAKVDAASLQRLPWLSELIVGRPSFHGERKRLLDLHGAVPEKLLTGAPLAAVLVPRIGAVAETRARPVTQGAALAAAAPSTLLQLPGSDEGAMRRLSAIVRGVPCYALEVGSDPALIPAEIEALLGGAR